MKPVSSNRPRWIMHVDMDAFFASVEQLDHPEYRNRPVIVGGLSGRGVVSTASYEARRFGVHSAMPMKEALERCPKGIFVEGRYGRYLELSQKIRQIFHEFSPLVEPLSIDEAFLDLTGMERLVGDIPALGLRIKERIKKETGLTASVGLAPNKFLAKLASDLKKPNGLVIIRQSEAASRIAPLPISRIFGIGARSASLLTRFGIRTIGDLAACDASFLSPLFGKNTETILRFAHGLDNRPVIPDEKRQSLGRELTFEKDLRDHAVILEILWNLSQEVGFRLRSAGLSGYTVTLKMKTQDFKVHTRSLSSDLPLQLDEKIMERVKILTRRNPLRDPVRLLGVTVSHLVPQESSEQNLFSKSDRNTQRSLAVDALKKRFGETIIKKGAPPIPYKKSHDL